MASKFAGWFKELPLVNKVAIGGGAGLIAALAVAAVWKVTKVLLLALCIGVVVALAITVLHVLLKRRGSGQGKSFSQELLRHIKKAKTEIGEQFERALQELKSNHVDIYNLPWFFFVGEPQSGKTFTIKSSGVDLPIGTEGISGAGGTRDCDFWFTSEAVILDTAGRLTVQQDEVIDRQQWNEVLRLLKRFRANCPINGALVCIPCTSLLEDDLPTREKKAEVIRNRLKEIQKELGIHFPIFLMVTKVDLVLGFEPFFRRLPVLERKQLLGWSNDARFDQPFNPAAFGAAFDSLSEDLQRWRLKLLNEEESPDNIDQFYVFPEEFKTLKGPMSDYMNKIFLTKPYVQPGFFRGFYFTSSLQEGRAIPQAIQSILGGVGDHYQKPAASLQEIQGRSSPFFVRDVYTRKVFAEKGLVLRSDRSKLMNALVRGTALWGGGAVLALSLLLLVLSYLQVGSALNRPYQHVVDVEEKKDQGEKCLAARENQVRLKDDSIDLGLGKTIQDWEKQKSAGWLRGIFQPVFRSPAQDQALIEDLKVIYRHHFETQHLVPFFNEAGGLLREKPPRNWEDFKARSENLINIVELVLGGPKGGPGRESRFKAVSDLLAAGSRTPRQPENLPEEFERYLRFAGDPSRVVPRDKALWKGLTEAAFKQRDFLLALLDPRTLEPAGEGGAQGFGIQFEDDLKWWRELLAGCREADQTYQDLLKLASVGADQKPEPPATFANRTTFARLREDWKDPYGKFAAAWTKLEAQLSGRKSEEVLDQRLSSLRSAIVTRYYADLLDSLKGAETESPESRECVAVIRGHQEEVTALAGKFETAFVDRLGGFSFLIELKPRPGAEGGAAAASEASRALTAYARGVREAIIGLNGLLTDEPGRLVESDANPAASFKKGGFREFKASLEKELQLRGEKLAKLVLPARLPGEKDRSRDLLEALAEDVKAGALTDVARTLLEAHLRWAGEEVKEGDGPASLAMDRWFYDQKSSGLLGTDTLFMLPANTPIPYQVKCRADLMAHLTELKTAIAAFKPPNLLPIPEYTQKLLDISDAYDARYVEFWKVKVDQIKLSASWPRDWKGFRDELKTGLGRTTAGALINGLVNSMKVTHQQVADLPGNHSFVKRMKKYTLPFIDDLGKQLNQFADFVDRNDKAVVALRATRKDRGIWLEGFPKAIKGLFKDDKESLDSEHFAQELLQLAENGKKALLKECTTSFDSDWKGLVKEQGPKMSGKFPFLGEERALDPIADCRLLRGEGETQVPYREFIELLGNQGALTTLMDTYDKPGESCLVELVNGDEPGEEAEYGMRIGKPRREFFAACRGLREFVLNPRSNTSQKVEFTISLPDKATLDEPLKESLKFSAKSTEIYEHYTRFEFAVNRALRGEQLQTFKSTQRGKLSKENLSWILSNENTGNDLVGKTGYYVFDDDWRDLFGDLKEPLELRSDCDQGQPPLTRIPLLFEAKGLWSFPLFLVAYGASVDETLLNPQPTKRASWLIRFHFHPHKFPESGKIIEPVAYLKVDLINKTLERLPDWSSVSEAGDSR